MGGGCGDLMGGGCGAVMGGGCGDVGSSDLARI
jgi:hypothetical protein